MTRLATERPFPARISESLTLAMGIVLVVLLLGSGISLTLALRIYLSVDAARQEFGHILKLNHVHDAFDDLISELQRTDDGQMPERTVGALQEEVARQLGALDAMYRAEGRAAAPEPAALGELRRLADEGRAVTERLAVTGRPAGPDLEWLNRTTHEIHRLTHELAVLHESRVTGLHERSRRLIQGIVVLFVVFTVVGVALVAVARYAASRGIATPLRRLADAAEGIAEGRLEARVPVGQDNEIGLLAQTFNTMAERLQEREREIRCASDALGQKVWELRSLFQIGTEIACLRQLGPILQSLVDKTRELLRGEAAALCIAGPEGGNPVMTTTSGPPEAFRPYGEAQRKAPAAEAPDAGDTLGSVIRCEYARGHVTAPLRLGQNCFGAIHVGTCEERVFTADEIELLSGLATQAAIAIERARLLEEVQNLAAVEERGRLAREMHDSPAQVLGLLHLKLRSVLERPGDAQAVADRLREMAEIANQGYEEVRQSIFSLRAFASCRPGLVPKVTDYLNEFSSQTGIAVELEVAEEPGPLPPAAEVQAFRIIQEALANVRKHARTDQARVRLQRNGAWVGVVIEDNGVGWDSRGRAGSLHFGLHTMRERAEGVGGRLEIDTAPGRGTRVVATFPGAAA